ncbi:TolC family protein [Lignipirellula cremea]|uniref:Cobalt-zinc-cadmium resistance protein CzcC n=1 Tax=Lignipirellula cremea TaxID=2528010 RepID=A0A518E3M5_9BACT|nr:TolC family protein [Lignipirellula cremea]QDU98696.1 Cobalt-zinc-cadmium resistance protein CzcC precursor [Lignipirellula cremea]
MTNLPNLHCARRRSRRSVLDGLPAAVGACASTATLLGVLFLAGCTVPQIGAIPLCQVNCELTERTSHEVLCAPPCTFVLPPDVSLEDGVTEDEAVAVALSNNSTFQATLTQLGMAEGDLIQAGLLTNPSFTTFIPVGVKQWEWTLYLPIEAFVLRPQRLSLASNQYESMAQQLVQNGLTLVRDVRVAHADLAVALAQWELSQEAVKTRQNIADLTEKRLARGDISKLEEITAQVDALNSQATTALLEQSVVVAESRLSQLMGLPLDHEPLYADLTPPTSLGELDVQALTENALARRPDIAAANWSVSAATHRAQLARWQFLRLDFVADANGSGEKGFELGPGLRFDIPIFNRNQGGVVRADAELTQTMYARDAVKEQVIQEVRAASAQWRQTLRQLAILEKQVDPALKKSLQITQKGFTSGGADYLLVLQATTQYFDSRARILDQKASLLRARAELERSIGGSLAAAAPGSPQMPEMLPPPVLISPTPVGPAPLGGWPDPPLPEALEEIEPDARP